MKWHKKITLSVIVIVSLFISKNLLTTDNMFWGKSGVSESSGVADAVIGSLLTSDSYIPEINYPAEGETVNNPLVVVGTCNDNVDSIEISIDDGPWQTAIGSENWSFSFITLSGGIHEIKARAILNNWTTSTSSRFFSIDSSNPTINITSGPSNDLITNRAFTVTLSVDDDFGYWSTNNSPFVSFPSGSVILFISNSITLKYFSQDLYNNTSATQTISYTIDNTPPEIYISAGPTNDTVMNVGFNVDLTVTDNYGYWSTNNSSYISFNSGTVSIPINSTVTLRFFGKDLLANSTATQTVIYTILNSFWVYGGNNSDRGHSIQQTIDGGYIATGYNSSLNGNPDVWLIKINPDGTTNWTKTYGGAGEDLGWSVRQTPDSGYIIVGETDSFGAGYSDVWVIKTDSSGNTNWTRTFGGVATEKGYSVDLTSDGGYIIAGYTGSYGLTHDIFLIKVNSTGGAAWVKNIDYSHWEDIYSVQETSDGGFILAGTFEPSSYAYVNILLVKTDSSGNSQWMKSYGSTNHEYGYSVKETSDNGFIVAGYSDTLGAGNYDIWLLKTDSTGNTNWAKTYGTSGWEIAHDVQQTSDGGYIIVGERREITSMSYNIYLIKTDSNGTVSWTKEYGGSASEYGYSVEQTSDNGYIICGKSISFGDNFLIIKTDSNGNLP